LSPNPKDKSEKVPNLLDEGDLTRVILDILGDQKDYDLSFISSRRSRKLVEALQPGKPKIRFQKEFEESPDFLIGILAWTLRYNPFFRPSALEILDSKELKFQSSKSPPLRNIGQVRLDVDKEGEYDYSTQIPSSVDAKQLKWRLF